MKKVLIVNDDLRSLMSTESVLKKVGFDVVGIGKEFALPVQLLSFRPDVVVVECLNDRRLFLACGAKLKEAKSFKGKIILASPQDFKPTSEELMMLRMDTIVEAPVTPEKLVELICSIKDWDVESYLNKLHRGKGPQVKSKALLPTVEENKKRMLKYQKITSGMKVDKSRRIIGSEAFSRWSIVKNAWKFDTLQDLAKQKLEFAKSLFRKKNK